MTKGAEIELNSLRQHMSPETQAYLKRVLAKGDLPAVPRMDEPNPFLQEMRLSELPRVNLQVKVEVTISPIPKVNEAQ